MVERLFWHIGQPKTGTTYLQKILWSNEEALAAQDIALPGGKHRWLLWAALDLGGHPGLAKRDKRAPGRWNKVVEEIRGSSATNGVISHEFFCRANAEQVSAAMAQLEGIEVHVVITARDAAGMLAAGWQEYVKHGRPQSLREVAALETPSEFGWWTWDLASVLERWTSALPGDRVHVLPVPGKDADPNQHWQNFADLIGYSGQVQLPERELNASLGVVQIEAMRAVNQHLGAMSATDRGDYLRGYLAEEQLSRQSSERVRLDDDLWADCAIRSERAVAMIKERGVHLVGDESRLLVPGTGPRGRLVESVTQAEVAASLAELSGGMIGHIRDVDGERRRLVKEQRRTHRELAAARAEIESMRPAVDFMAARENTVLARARHRFFGS